MEPVMAERFLGLASKALTPGQAVSGTLRYRSPHLALSLHLNKCGIPASKYQHPAQGVKPCSLVQKRVAHFRKYWKVQFRITAVTSVNTPSLIPESPP